MTLKRKTTTQQSEKKQSSTKGILILSVIIWGFILFSVGSPIRSHLQAERLMSEQNLVTAQVTGVNQNPSSRRGGASTTLNLRYEINGTIYNQRIHVRPVRPEAYVGERLELYYSAQNPNRFIFADRSMVRPPFSARRDIPIPLILFGTWLYLICALMKGKREEKATQKIKKNNV